MALERNDVPMSEPSDAQQSVMQRFLNLVERVGNLVPHPVLIFLILIGIVIGLSHVLYLTGASVTTEVIVPESPTAEATTTDAPDDVTADDGVADAGMSGAAGAEGNPRTKDEKGDRTCQEEMEWVHWGQAR